MRTPQPYRDSTIWRANAKARVVRASTNNQQAACLPEETSASTIHHVHLLFWGSAWEGKIERRERIAAAFRDVIVGSTEGAERSAASDPLVKMSVVSVATHTSPGDPPDLIANADVTALVANLMSKRAVSPWAGGGVALYCVVLCPIADMAEGQERFAYTAYRENTHDVHCGWLVCHDDPEMIADCVCKLLAEVESALLTDVV